MMIGSFTAPNVDYKALGSPHNKKSSERKYPTCETMDCFPITIYDSPEDEVESFSISLELRHNAEKYAELVNTTATVFIIPSCTCFAVVCYM